MRKLILLVALIIPVMAQPIGRSGNGKMLGLEDGFVSQIPPQFPEGVTGADGSIRLENPNLPMGSNQPSVLYAHRFAVFYPTRANMDRDTLKLEFAANGWTVHSVPQDACVDLYHLAKGSTEAVVAVWGIGKGVVFLGPQMPLTTYSIDYLVKNLELEAGACTWK